MQNLSCQNDKVSVWVHTHCCCSVGSNIIPRCDCFLLSPELWKTPLWPVLYFNSVPHQQTDRSTTLPTWLDCVVMPLSLTVSYNIFPCGVRECIFGEMQVCSVHAHTCVSYHYPVNSFGLLFHYWLICLPSLTHLSSLLHNLFMIDWIIACDGTRVQ